MGGLLYVECDLIGVVRERTGRWDMFLLITLVVYTLDLTLRVMGGRFFTTCGDTGLLLTLEILGLYLGVPPFR